MCMCVHTHASSCFSRLLLLISLFLIAQSSKKPVGVGPRRGSLPVLLLGELNCPSSLTVTQGLFISGDLFTVTSPPSCRSKVILKHDPLDQEKEEIYLMQ